MISRCVDYRYIDFFVLSVGAAAGALRVPFHVVQNACACRAVEALLLGAAAAGKVVS